MVRKIARVAARVARKLVHSLDPRRKLNLLNRGTINLVEVGSVGGLPQPWSVNAGRIKFLLNFEPNDEPSQSANCHTYNTALWEADTVRPFYIYKGLDGSGSSLFKPIFKFVEENYKTLARRGPKNLAETWFDRSTLIEVKEVKCKGLENIIKEEFPSTPFHFIKIDAQGAEYNILKGATTLLSGSCVGLYLYQILKSGTLKGLRGYAGM